MKFKSLLLVIIFGLLTFFFLDAQKVLTAIYKCSVDIYRYVTQEEIINPPKEPSPIVQGKPCIVPGGIAYYSPGKQEGHVEVIIEKVSEKPSQALVKIKYIKTKKAFKYKNIKYYNDEELWLLSEELSCELP